MPTSTLTESECLHVLPLCSQEVLLLVTVMVVV